MIGKVPDIKEGFPIRRKGVDDADPLQVGQPYPELLERQVHVIGKDLRLEPGRVPLGDAVVVGTGPETRKGQARELLRVRHPEQLRIQAWSPAGDAVLYTRASGDRPYELWVIPVNGAPARRLGVSFIRSGSGEPNGLTLNVDGVTIAYPERVVQSELWISEWPPN